MLAPSYIFLLSMKCLTWRHFLNIFIFFVPNFNSGRETKKKLHSHTWHIYSFCHLWTLTDYRSILSHICSFDADFCRLSFLISRTRCDFLFGIFTIDSCLFTKPNEVDHFVKHFTLKSSSWPALSLCLSYKWMERPMCGMRCARFFFLGIT